MYPKSIKVLESVIRETTRLLQDFGNREAVVYWAGLDLGAQWVVLAAICPKQENSRGSFFVTSSDNARVVLEVSRHGLAILGQVHTHPGIFVGHSDGDDEWAAFAFPGFISVVVPMFAQRGMLPLTACGIHQHRKRFRRLSDGDVAKLFSIVPASVDQRERRLFFRC